MTRSLAWALAVSLSLGGSACAEGLPSGAPIVMWEIVWERVEGAGTQAVLRFIEPAIARDGGSLDAEAAALDMDWLCATHGLPVVGLPTAKSDTLVINLMDRPVPRGVTDADSTQYFGIYAIVDGKCSPEIY